MAKEITCQNCKKIYWDDLERCPRCNYPRNATGGELEATTWPKQREAKWENENTILEQAQAGLLGWLIVKEGARRGQTHPVRHESTVGREDATIVIRDPKISRPHARFTVQNDQFFVWDFGTPNGTIVNGQRIDRATPLKENDVIQIGETVFLFKTMN
jgi:pSer/pThr/pTyr-binding forkhead associated (FHA) protein